MFGITIKIMVLKLRITNIAGKYTCTGMVIIGGIDMHLAFNILIGVFICVCLIFIKIKNQQNKNLLIILKVLIVILSILLIAINSQV